MDEAKNFMLSMMNTLKERIGNPFIGAFATAWIIWNFKIVLVVFSQGNGGWKAKIDYIFKDLMKDWVDWSIHGYLVPFIVACIWIFALPPVLRWVSFWHEKQNNLTRKKLFEANEEKVLSKADELVLRKHILDEQIKIIEQRERDSKALQNLIDEGSKLAAEKSNLQKELSKSNEEVNKLSHKEINLSSEIERLIKIINPDALTVDKNKKLDDSTLHEYAKEIGFSEYPVDMEYISTIKHKKFKIIFPMTILRDVIYGHNIIFKKGQIIDDYVISNLFVLHDIYDEKNTWYKDELKSKLHVNREVNAEKILNYLVMLGYLSKGVSNNFERYLINECAFLAGLFLIRFGFQIDYDESRNLTLFPHEA